MSRSKRNAAAADYFNRAPNYSAEAIKHLRTRGEAKLSDGLRGGELLVLLAMILEAAHKFALPYGGTVFETLPDEMLLDWRLPFETCAFEYAQRLQVPVAGQPSHVDRVIVLCQNLPEADTTVLFPILHFANDGWRASIVSYEFRRAGEGNLTGFFIRRLDDLRWGQRDLLPSEAELRECGKEAWSFEIWAVAQACAALACTNVTTEVIRPNREARAARPASTLFDYHILMIEPGREHPPGEDRGGTHASPRTHLRRGHIRRLAWGPRVWVNSCVVNPSAIGTVNKDYKVTA